MTNTPYKGLVPFYEKDTLYFFGREIDRAIIETNLMTSRLTLLYGESGIGKTSVLRAGVVVNLHKVAEDNFRKFEKSEIATGVFSSWLENDPVSGLIECARDAVNYALREKEEILKVEPRDLAMTLQMLTKRLQGKIFLILDQFEEFFHYHAQKSTCDTFVREFSSAINQADLSVNFLISIREDSLAWLDRFEGYIPGLFDNFLRIQHLDKHSAREAILRPVEKYSEIYRKADTQISIEDKLAEELLSQLRINKKNVNFDMFRRAEYKPEDPRYEAATLQLVMERLWREERKVNSNILRFETLNRLKGVENIVKTHVSEAMAVLGADEYDVAAQIFIFLVTPTGMKTALSVQDLVEYTHAEKTIIVSVLDALSRHGGPQLLRSFTPSPSRPAIYEASHDLIAKAIKLWLDQYTKQKQERELNQVRAKAEHEKARRERELVLGLLARSLVSLRDECGLLLARQAYIMEQRAGGQFMDVVDNALREMLVKPYYGPVLDHRNEVAKVAFSPDGETLASASYDRIIRLWNLKNLHQVPTILCGHEDNVNSVAYSANGRLIASGSKDKTIRIWKNDVISQEMMTIRGHEEEITCIAFSPDNQLLASASRDCTVRIWNLAMGGYPVVLRHENWVWSIAFSPDGSTLASGDKSGRVHLWYLDNLTSPREKIIGKNFGEVFSLTFSLDGSILASGSGDGIVRLWQMPEAVLPFLTLPGHFRNVMGVAISPDNHTLASGDDQTVRLWDLRNPSHPPTILHGHSMGISSVAFSPDGKTLASSSWDWKVRVWPLARPAASTNLRHGKIVRSVTFSNDGNMLLSGGDDRNVRLWDLLHPEHPYREFKGHCDEITSVAFSPAGEMFASGSYDSTIRLWSLSSGSTKHDVRILSGHQGWVTSIAYTPDGQILVSGGTDHSVMVWEVNKPDRKGQKLPQWHTDKITSVAVSPNGRWIASGSRDKRVALWDLHNLDAPSKTYQGHDDGIACVAFSPDSRLLAAGSYDRKVFLWSLDPDADTNPVNTLCGHNLGIHSLMFSKEGNILASGSNDWTVRLWNLRNLKAETAPIILRNREGGISTVAFDPAAEKIAFGSYWGTIVIDIARTSILADMVCRIARRNLGRDEWQHFLGDDIPYEKTCPEFEG